ncbi:hypothetical protein Y032_0452g1698 [Ancylostoma ceylanicum]|uniref:Uncharacterized protein n=1 Tax=Ancylostoma ceylanicum TaxID=53326 RepID=A0A016WY20_9BILA|nr:hypothetical protein Y032_0452g1698 [Ancylostoma ceylanicum]
MRELVRPIALLLVADWLLCSCGDYGSACDVISLWSVVTDPPPLHHHHHYELARQCNTTINTRNKRLLEAPRAHVKFIAEFADFVGGRFRGE